MYSFVFKIVRELLVFGSYLRKHTLWDHNVKLGVSNFYTVYYSSILSECFFGHFHEGVPTENKNKYIFMTFLNFYDTQFINIYLLGYERMYLPLCKVADTSFRSTCPLHIKNIILHNETQQICLHNNERIISLPLQNMMIFTTAILL